MAKKIKIKVRTYIAGLTAIVEHNKDIFLLLPHVSGEGEVDRHVPFLLFLGKPPYNMGSEIKALLKELSINDEFLPSPEILQSLGVIRLNREEVSLSVKRKKKPKFRDFDNVINMKRIYEHSNIETKINPNCLELDEEGLVAGRFLVETGIFHPFNLASEKVHGEKLIFNHKFQSQATHCYHKQYIADAILLTQTFKVKKSRNPYIKLLSRKYYKKKKTVSKKVYAYLDNGKYFIDIVIANIDPFTGKPGHFPRADHFAAFYNLFKHPPSEANSLIPVSEGDGQDLPYLELPTVLRVLASETGLPSFPSSPQKCPGASFLDP